MGASAERVAWLGAMGESAGLFCPPSELFVADYSAARRGTPDFDKLVRYELAKVEEFARPL